MDDSELVKYPGLGFRKGAWYVRKRTPVDLQHVERRRSVRYSLDTTNFGEAVKLYPFKMAEIEADFERMRHELPEPGKVSAALTADKLERLSAREIGRSLPHGGRSARVTGSRPLTKTIPWRCSPRRRRFSRAVTKGTVILSGT